MLSYLLAIKNIFLTWYQQLQAQCDAYNIKLRPLDEFNILTENAKNISKYENFKPPVETKTGQLLLNKLSETTTITDEFKEGRQLLSSVKNGFEFLDTFLREMHPKFFTSSVVSEDIPKYSNYNNIYDYCRGVKDYYF